MDADNDSREEFTGRCSYIGCIIICRVSEEFKKYFDVVKKFIAKFK